MPQTSPMTPNTALSRHDDQVVTFKRDRRIGQVLASLRGLDAASIERVLRHQRQHGGRFGETALSLGLASEEDIFEALAEQFEYPYLRDAAGFDSELVCASDPLGEDAHGFRELRAELVTGVLDRTVPRALAVVSPQRGDGRSYVAANLAIAFAQLGGRTLLIDADLQVPRQHALFRVDDSVGLSQLLAGRIAAEHVVQPSPVPGLLLLAAGPIPPNPAELLHRGSFAALIRELLAKFDYVVLDTSAASQGTEARILAAMAGAALVVARPHAARLAALQRLVAAVGKGPAALAGVVMNEH
ncbi:polysaccharide biosynthesis tyrosine autokinase [Ramlibacter tataouinensis]|uniref:polysaccharide biosynthesis tyrosine autokinase n=1 Tax=Ramlibacter tataouinensis TaxID=94132 RepID=UPI0022F3AB2D|nr:polysaccharide biosynthesis tyrosine autokinase [Ramlibacter tataouinensis]WBY00795.1 polysaccharide biosynthesis tyrosine autokinase [Ramlibacter tataouinensis]